MCFCFNVGFIDSQEINLDIKKDTNSMKSKIAMFTSLKTIRRSFRKSSGTGTLEAMKNKTGKQLGQSANIRRLVNLVTF